jgi:hypothetical protein
MIRTIVIASCLLAGGSAVAQTTNCREMPNNGGYVCSDGSVVRALPNGGFQAQDGTTTRPLPNGGFQVTTPTPAPPRPCIRDLSGNCR